VFPQPAESVCSLFFSQRPFSPPLSFFGVGIFFDTSIFATSLFEIIEVDNALAASVH
jgi:hypothetical protein